MLKHIYYKGSNVEIPYTSNMSMSVSESSSRGSNLFKSTCKLFFEISNRSFLNPSLVEDFFTVGRVHISAN
jgi:hypothetical protein